jgi:hypothetical protein
MSSPFLEKFIKKSSEYGALFHLFPGAVYEFRDKIWRVKQIQGSPPISIYISNAFQRLLSELKNEGIVPTTATVPKTGTSEVFPQSWYCSNPACNRFEAGTLRSRSCQRCGQEMRQLPLVVVCDSCGYLDAIRQPSCERCGNGHNLRIVMYERYAIGTWRIVCQTCLERVLTARGIPPNQPERFKPYESDFHIWSDLEPGTRCPRCRADHVTDPKKPGKRVVPAGANVVTPAFKTTFDQDMLSMKSRAVTTASKEMSTNADWKTTFERIQRVFGIKDIYLARIMALSCTYGYKVAKFQTTLPFQGNNVYLRADEAEAILFEFDLGRIPVDKAKEVLHSAAHAFVQVAGYVTGLGSEAYREYFDVESGTAMIFTTEAGGCDVLVTEKAKLLELLKRARAIVHNCKNQCPAGCPWCIQVRPIQCARGNRELDRTSLATLWQSRFIYSEEEVDDNS